MNAFNYVSQWTNPADGLSFITVLFAVVGQGPAQNPVDKNNPNLFFFQDLSIIFLSRSRLSLLLACPSVLATIVELPSECDTPEEGAEDPRCFDGSLLQEVEWEEEEEKRAKDVGATDAWFGLVSILLALPFGFLFRLAFGKFSLL